MTAEVGVTIRALAKVWPRQTAPDGTGLCIEEARRAVAVLSRLDIPAKASATRCMAANAAAIPVLAAKLPIEEWPADAWSVGTEIGACQAESTAEPFRRQGWSGHVVVIGDGWLLDLTAPQFSRPLKGIHVPGPITTGYDAAMGVAHYNLALGGLVLYHPQPKVAKFRTSNAWQGAQMADIDELVRMVERRVA